MQVLVKILILLFLSALLAGGRALFLGEPPEPEGAAYAVSAERALAMEEVIWVDGRSRIAFDQAHMPGAVFLGTTENSYQRGMAELLSRWDPRHPVVAYCDGQGCAVSRELAERLRSELGVDNILWVEGGWSALEEARQQ